MAGRNKQIQGETNPILTKFAMGYQPVQGIAHLVAPRVESLTESGTIYSFGKEGFMIYDSERALRAATKKIDFHLSKDTYRCAEHALESSLDYKELEIAERYNAKKVLSLEKRAVMLTQRALQTELEKAVADIIFNATYYASGNKVTLTGGDKFSDYDNSDPVDVVKTGLIAARADMGIEPNTGVIGYTAWKRLREHPKILDRIKYSMTAVLTPELVAQVLGLKKLIVGEGVYSTDAGVFTDLWGDYFALIYVPESSEMVEGTTPHTIVVEELGYPEVKIYNSKKTVDYETTRKYNVKNVSTSNGYLISDMV